MFSQPRGRDSLWIHQTQQANWEGSKVTHAVPSEVKQLILERGAFMEFGKIILCFPLWTSTRTHLGLPMLSFPKWKPERQLMLDHVSGWIVEGLPKPQTRCQLPSPRVLYEVEEVKDALLPSSSCPDFICAAFLHSKNQLPQILASTSSFYYSSGELAIQSIVIPAIVPGCVVISPDSCHH